MPRYKMHLIRPPEPDFSQYPLTNGKDRYRCWRYNGGDWIEDDGQPDLAFVSILNGWPFAYGAEFPSREQGRNSIYHPNVVAFEAAMGYCTGLCSVANGRHIDPVKSHFITIQTDPDQPDAHYVHYARGRALRKG